MPPWLEVGPEPVEEVGGLGQRLPGEQPVEPVQVGLAGHVGGDLAVLTAGLANPRRYPVAGDPVHGRGADQHAHQLTALAVAAADQHRGVQRTVHVVLRHADVVAEPLLDRAPAAVQRAERDVAVGLGPVHHHHDPGGVGGSAGPAGQLSVDRVQVTRPHFDLGPQADCGEFLARARCHVGQEGVPGAGGLQGERPDPLVRLGREVGERQVLHLPLVVIQPEPLRERNQELHRGPGDPLALLPLGVGRQGPQVVHPVGQLDDQDSQVDGGGDDHLLEGLGLGVIAPAGAVELGHPVDEDRHLRAELGLDLADRQAGVLHRVVQQRRDQRGGVHADLGQQDRDGQWVGDVGGAGLAGLPGVPVVGDGVGAAEQIRVRAGEHPAVGGDQRTDRVRAGRTGPAQADGGERSGSRRGERAGRRSADRYLTVPADSHQGDLLPYAGLHRLLLTLALDRAARRPLE